jgi:plasmid stabilization system protein ParE
MLSHTDRDAERTERYVDELLAAGDRGAADVPVDARVDPLVHGAARRLRADLNRVHPSFRFEEVLAERLASASGRMRAGLPAEAAGLAAGGTVTVFPVALEGAASDTGGTSGTLRAILPPAAFRRIPELKPRSSRPLIVGGVGVASAAISLGAVFVAWRYSRPSSGRMERAVKAAHGRTAGSSRNRRRGPAHGIFGVMS